MQDSFASSSFFVMLWSAGFNWFRPIRQESDVNQRFVCSAGGVCFMAVWIVFYCCDMCATAPAQDNEGLMMYFRAAAAAVVATKCVGGRGCSTAATNPADRPWCLVTARMYRRGCRLMVQDGSNSLTRGGTVWNHFELGCHDYSAIIVMPAERQIMSTVTLKHAIVWAT